MPSPATSEGLQVVVTALPIASWDVPQIPDPLCAVRTPSIEHPKVRDEGADTCHVGLLMDLK